jgi:restriction system protein
MKRYWVVAPYESEFRETWQKVWQFDLQKGVISIGWRELGDFSSLNRDDLMNAVGRAFPEVALQTKTLWFNMIWSFYHNIQIGDIVIARQGRKRIAGIGSVIGKAYYSAKKNTEATGPGREYPNHIDVRWYESPRDKDFSNIVFGMQTIYEIKEELYNKLVENPVNNTIQPIEEDIENQAEFTLEKYLEDFIVTNFSTIFHDKLVMYKDTEENMAAQQYGTEAGTIDILAQEPSTNSFVVIELKKGRESDKVVGQTLRYMGWVNDNLCKQGQGVRGIVICKEADPKLAYALKMAPNISVKYYKVNFKLTDTP